VIAEAISIDSAPNPGLASSVFRSQSALTVLAAVALLHGELDVVALGAVVVTLVGVYFSSTGRQTSNRRAAEQHRQVLEKSGKGDGPVPGKGWVKAALIAAGLMTVKDLLAVVSVRGGSQAEATVAVEALVATIVAFAYKKYKTGTLRLVTAKRSHAAPWWVLPAGSAVMALWPLMAVTAMVESPNSGYPKALALSGVAISAMVSSYMYNEPLTDRAWGGIGLIILGTAGLMFRGT
jgi:multidrug transporter EmrE-like cation transporter